MDSVDCVVVGAGVIGLAVARALARAGVEVIVLEAEAAIGQHASSRNSEVIHAGLYYPPGSVKARTCLEGRERLYAYCAERGIPHRRCGKLVVAADETQVAELAALRERAHANGARDVDWVSPARVRALEPELRCVAALHSPSTGILDSHAYLLALLADAEAAGATLVCRTPLLAAECSAGGGFLLQAGGAEPLRFKARFLVNAAGLRAPSVARRIAGYPAERAPRELYAKGSYFALARRSPFRCLVYPVPEPGGLGVHLTLDLAGRARFGPDVEWTDRIDYAVDPLRAERFYAAIRRYWPALPDGALVPDYAGVRAKIVGPGEPAADFVVEGPAAHGIEGLVHLYGIESPGLTASLALADDVVTALRT